MKKKINKFWKWGLIGAGLAACALITLPVITSCSTTNASQNSGESNVNTNEYADWILPPTTFAPKISYVPNDYAVFSYQLDNIFKKNNFTNLSEMYNNNDIQNKFNGFVSNLGFGVSNKHYAHSNSQTQLSGFNQYEHVTFDSIGFETPNIYTTIVAKNVVINQYYKNGELITEPLAIGDLYIYNDLAGDEAGRKMYNRDNLILGQELVDNPDSLLYQWNH